MIVSVEQLTKAFTDRRLLDGIDFYLQEGEKVGIIGQNGCGKSTFLRILAGAEEADTGSVQWGNHTVCSYLPQTPDFREEASVLESVLAGFTQEERWNVESDAKAMLNRLGVTDHDQPVQQLSGGQKKRVALAAALLVPSDVLLLDEPTNHLDHEMVEWLEQRLKAYRGAIVMVTHDRYFLDSVTGHIVELFRGKAFRYECSYSGFLEQKAERLRQEESAEQKRQNLLRNELAWVRRGAQARSTKQKARLERFEELNAKKAPEKEETTQISAVSSRMGRTTVELSHISKAWPGRCLIRDFSYIFLKRDRVGFIGENGCGKTTLMNIIAGREQPDTGSVVIGQTITIGYYSQLLGGNREDGIAWMDPEKRVIDYIKDTAEYVRTDEGLVSASAMLERFLFSGDKQYAPIGKLSGGEKRRLNLLRVLMQAPNVLILDEPTNDLDLTTLTILEDYLDRFDGIVITVSHDRYFLDRIVRRIFAFEGDGELVQYEGGYTDYQWKKQQLAEEQTPEKAVSGKKSSGKGRQERPAREKKLKFTWQEQRDYETIEEEISSLEEKCAELEQEMERSASDFVRLNELQAQLEAANQLLDEKMERWEYLEELAARISEAQNEGKEAAMQ